MLFVIDLYLFTLQVEKTIFVVFFSGEQARRKILKICEAFGAHCYPVPEDITKQRQIIREVSVLLWQLVIFHLLHGRRIPFSYLFFGCNGAMYPCLILITVI